MSNAVIRVARSSNAPRSPGIHAGEVHTIAAYAADPQVTPDEVAALAPSATHVVVAVLAFAGPRAELAPYRFARNLAGGNREALAWSAEEIRRTAAAVADYDDAWCVVAD